MNKTAEDIDINEKNEQEKFFSFDKEKKKDFSKYIKPILFLFAGFGFSQVNALGDMSPFSIAFLSATPFDFCIFSLIGSVVGYFAKVSWQVSLKYCAGLLIVTVFRFIVNKRFKKSEDSFSGCIVAFCSVCVAGVGYLAFTDFTVMGVLIVVAEGLFSLCSAYFFMRAFRTPVMSIGIGRLSVQDSISIVLSLCSFTLCFSGFTVGYISPIRIICAILVIFIGNYRGVAAGAISGVCVGASLCIEPSLRHLFPFYALGGLACGIFSPLGQLASSISFAICAAVVTLLNSPGADSFATLFEGIIGAAAFIIIPSKFLSTIEDFLERSGISPDNSINREVSASLRNAANSMKDVSRIVTKVSDKLDSVINPEVNKVFAKLQQNICCGCSHKSECWNKMFDKTASDILYISGVDSKVKIKTDLEERCPRGKALVSQIGQSYTDYVSSIASKMKVKEMRSVVTDQFLGVSQFLQEIAQQVATSRIKDMPKSRALMGAFCDSGIYVDALNYFTDDNSRVTVEITLIDRGTDIDHRRMKTIIEFVTKRRFERAEIAVLDLRTTITFEEKAIYRINTGSAQISYKNSAVCGDCVGKTTDKKGNEIAIISDGMGTGSRAAIDGTMTASLMEKLLSSGFSFDSALKMVNSALIVKSTDESMATVDAVSINVYTGIARFFKAGAAISFIRSGTDISVIEEPSLPVGIIRNVAFSKRTCKLTVGDIVLLVSDGVTVGDCGWINDELLAWSTNSMDDLCAHIACLAKLRATKDNRDDITVVASKVMKNS